jgi:hypothetical protein
MLSKYKRKDDSPQFTTAVFATTSLPLQVVNKPPGSTLEKGDVVTVLDRIIGNEFKVVEKKHKTIFVPEETFDLKTIPQVNNYFLIFVINKLKTKDTYFVACDKTLEMHQVRLHSFSLLTVEIGRSWHYCESFRYGKQNKLSGCKSC